MANWTISPGDWCHVDVPASNRQRAADFYRRVFGWQMFDIPDEPGAAGYTMIKTSDDGIESGIGDLAESAGLSSVGSGPVPYIRSDNFGATLARVMEAGGEILLPETDVRGYGWFALFRDTEGNVIGLWRDAEAHPE